MEINMSTKTKAEGFEPIRITEGIYPAELKEVKDISDGQYGARVAFIYTIGNKELALVCCKSRATKDNKIGQTLIAHGVEITDGKMNTDNLPRKNVNVWVEDYVKETEFEGKKTKKTYSTISKVKPLAETEKVK